jgi:hypothetical protein
MEKIKVQKTVFNKRKHEPFTWKEIKDFKDKENTNNKLTSKAINVQSDNINKNFQEHNINSNTETNISFDN